MDRNMFAAHQELRDAAHAAATQRANDTIKELRQQLAWEREDRKNIKHTQFVIGVVVGLVVACFLARAFGVWS